MQRPAALSFTRKAAQVRLAVFGVDAYWRGQVIRVAMRKVDELELASGGYEQGGMVQAFTLQNGIEMHDRLVVDGKTYRVTEVATNPHTPEIKLTMQVNK
jgi:hypothetical protein